MYLYVMKLFDLYEKINESEDDDLISKIFSTDERWELDDYVSMFSGLDTLYQYMEMKGYGDRFISLLRDTFDDYLGVIESLDLSLPSTSREDDELFTKHIFKHVIQDSAQELTYDESKDKVFMDLEPGDESVFFRIGRNSCINQVKEVFTGELDMWEPYDTWGTPLSDLLGKDMLDEDSYVKILNHLISNYENTESGGNTGILKKWKEEGDTDNDSFYLTKDKINFLLQHPNREVLTDMLESTSELEVIVSDIRVSYNEAYNQIMVNSYIKQYYDMLEGSIGKPIWSGERDHWYSNNKSKIYVNRYDVTSWVKDSYYNSILGYDVESIDVLEVLIHDFSDLVVECPREERYPDNVEVSFNERLGDYIS
tara:strand:- start:331 stop:1434 length:1104 start_codon:yes stop_codon:yes gene_type:complete